MGIIEFHFHDPEFDFSPSMTTGGEEGTDGESVDLSDDHDGWEPDDDSGGAGIGALVALAVLVTLAVLAGLKRRKGGSDGDEEDVELEA